MEKYVLVYLMPDYDYNTEIEFYENEETLHEKVNEVLVKGAKVFLSGELKQRYKYTAVQTVTQYKPF